MVIVGIGTGIRRGDLFNLTWERIDIQRGLIYVPGCLKSTNRTWIGSVQGAVAPGPTIRVQNPCEYYMPITDQVAIAPCTDPIQQ